MPKQNLLLVFVRKFDKSGARKKKNNKIIKKEAGRRVPSGSAYLTRIRGFRVKCGGGPSWSPVYANYATLAHILFSCLKK